MGRTGKLTTSGHTILAGVMGSPVSHSRSPRLHSYWLNELGIDGVYLPLATSPENFETAFRALAMLGFRGCNVTLPHKEAALALSDECDEISRRVGAVNTVVITDHGRYIGSNTDVFGFLENLVEQAPDWPTDKPAVVLGAGGSARAIACALQMKGIPEIRIANRTLARAQDLAANLGEPVVAVRWDERRDVLDGAGLLVNSTQLGMAGQPPLDMSLDPLSRESVVYDIVYVPQTTELLSAAAIRGNRTVGGLGMLLHQARPGFAAWFGTQPVVSPELYAFVTEDLHVSAQDAGSH